jgi:probable F420-dependent oxidoreductase
MATRVGLGLIDFPFASADGYWRWVDLCEAGGADSIWQSDRLVGEAPLLECMSVMAALAGRTRRLKFGMSVLSLGWRRPLVVAKACATIDFLSGGRLLPAFGLGALAVREWAALGIEPEGRGAAMDEALELMVRLWRGETVDLDGAHVKARGARISPLPVQAELPLWIGGSSPAAIRRTARFGTGWLGGIETPEEAAPVVAAIKVAAREAGRTIDPDHFGAGVFYRFAAPGEAGAAAALAPLPGVERNAVVGDAEAILERIRAYEAAGATKLVLRPLARGDEEVLVQTRRLIEEVLPRV